MSLRHAIQPRLAVITVCALLLIGLVSFAAIQLVSATPSKATKIVSNVIETDEPSSAKVLSQASINQACTPYGPAATPSDVNLSTAATGLTQQIDPIAHYSIYGTTASDLEQQVAKCAPNDSGTNQAEFTAETSYRLNWQYDFQTLSDGTCSVTNAKIGLHVTMVLPDWQQTQSATSDLTAHWQNFMTNLQTHETGHQALDIQHAQRLLTDLQNFPAGDCSSLPPRVSYMIDAAVNTLNQANDNYDTQTNHGATQGAILP